MMKLILKKAVENLGEAGEVVSVKAGFGRNYLVPQGLAYEASEANMRRLEEEQKRADERARRDYLEARRRAAQFAGMSLTFHARAGEGDDAKLFGSVTNADIADRANASGKLDFELDKRAVVLDEPLKSLGTFEVPVHLHAEVDLTIQVNVEREEA
ncbi:MAG TPA: 50S ribosomal protein L9 [Longimicrobiales bacterium]|nr:50S ribosomal protein L9 [Longimicrobiales bacterium]